MNERIRKLFENRPIEAPVQRERQNKPRRTFAKAASDEEVQDDTAPEAPEEEVLELDVSDDGNTAPSEDDGEKE
jgi:hypothetical protein